MSHSRAPQTAPWKALLQEQVNENMKENKASINYTIGTLAQSDDGVVPRLRTVVHRGFLNERRKSDPPHSSSNDGSLESSHLVFCTDVRSDKVKELVGSQGKMEINWWLPVTNVQFRFRGRAHVVSAPREVEIKSLGDEKLHTALWEAFPGSRLAPGDGSQAFNWEEERLRHFRKLKPDLRASFTRPDHPGTPIPPNANANHSKPADDEADKYSEATFQTKLEPLDPSQAKDDKVRRLVQESLDNFAIVIVEVTELDLAELNHPPEGVGRRTKWTLQGGEWKGQRIAP